MQLKSENRLRIVRSAAALVIAALIITGSVFSVAAAVQASTQPEQSSTESSGFSTVSEQELCGGDLIITDISDFNATVDIVEASKIEIIGSGETVTVMLARGTVGDALEKAGITLSENQTVLPSEDTVINGDMTVEISDGINVTVTADGKTQTITVFPGTVEQALESAGYEIGEDDLITPSAQTEALQGMNITLRRVTYRTEVTEEKISYDSVTEYSDELELGDSEVKTEGEDGTEQVTKKCKYIDGEKVSEEETDRKVIKKATDKVTVVGTKGSSVENPAGTFTDSSGVTVAYSKVISGSATAYTASSGALTATGVPAYYGGVAVNPNIIPYGSKLYIASADGTEVYGYCTAVDTGGALMEGSALVDCFFNSYSECVSFGRQNVNVYIL